MKPTLSAILSLGRFPNFKITSAFRSNSDRHTKYSAVDIVPLHEWGLDDEADVLLAKFLDEKWLGGLGVNFGDDCRHFHLDRKKGKDRWLERSRNISGTCSERLEVLPFPKYPKLTEKEKAWIQRYWNQDPKVFFNNETIPLSVLVKRLEKEPNLQPIPETPKTSKSPFNFAGIGIVLIVFIVILSFSKKGKKNKWNY